MPSTIMSRRGTEWVLAAPLPGTWLIVCIIVNNISTCLAQQTSPPPSVVESNGPPPSRAILIDNARQWASKALAVAATVGSSDRNEECDIGCATATHNLGEFFEMEGRVAEARQKYKEAESLAKAAGFAEGQTNARAGLTRLKEFEKA